MPKILFLLNSEFGQANVFMAIGHALQALVPDVELHIISFEPIRPEVEKASEQSLQNVKQLHGIQAKPWKLHTLSGRSWTESIMDVNTNNYLGGILESRPSFSTVIALYRNINRFLLPWEGPIFVQFYNEIVKVVEEVQPDMAVVESLFTIGLTACRKLGLKHVILSPNTLKEFASVLQPWGAFFWKYPILGTGIPFPIPFHLIPLNIVYAIISMWYTLTDPRAREIAKYVGKELGTELVTMGTLMLSPLPGQKILSATRPELDFPLAKIPEHIFPCGPIIRPVKPVAELDPELATWLARGPTVLICLGTHRYFEEDEAVEMAMAIKHLLDMWEDDDEIGGIRGKLQVLWKLKKPAKSNLFVGGEDYSTGPGSHVYSLLAGPIQDDRLRIVDWIKPQPMAVLLTGQVVCSVNHGGANSFNEAVIAGVPQVVLPAWLDCYDFGSRAEVLGIGIWGSKTSAPRCVSKELGPALVEVVVGRRADEMRKKAKELAALCAESSGEQVAARYILDVLEGKKDR